MYSKLATTDATFFLSYWDYTKKRIIKKWIKKNTQTFSGVCLAADWVCETPVLGLSIPPAVSICDGGGGGWRWWCFCSTAAWWWSEDGFLLMGDSGSNLVVESVFTADPESVLSSPDFELPCNNDTNHPRKRSQMAFITITPKNNSFLKKLINFRESSKST